MKFKNQKTQPLTPQRLRECFASMKKNYKPQPNIRYVTLDERNFADKHPLAYKNYWTNLWKYVFDETQKLPKCPW